MIELVLFENDPQAAIRAMAYGISNFIVDWEKAGKEERQKNCDTEIRPGSLKDLEALSKVPGAAAWCRINRYGPQTGVEIERAVAAGARGLFLPMVTSPAEVEAFLRRVDGRCASGVLVESM